MQLNELVKNYSINTISQKTNIAIEVLKKLINKDWENLQRSKVNGFLQIIEREFNVDLSEIKEEAKEYYKEHKDTKAYRPIDLVDAQVEGGSSKRLITNILTFVILALVSYAVWYYLSQKNHNNFTSETNSSKGLFRNSLDTAKNLINSTDNNSNKDIENNNSQEDKITSTTTNKAEVNNTNKELKDSNSSEEKRKFDIEINASNKTEETNNTNEQISKTIPLVDTPKSEDTNDTLNKDESVAKDINVTKNLETEYNNSTQTKNDSNSSDVSSIKADENLTMQDKDLTNEQNNTATKELKSITITPTVKRIWIGIYNLKTKKRVVKVATSAYTYNSDGGDVAIVTGHSRFKIATNTGATSEYHDAGKKKYLLISQDGIKVLTKKEYKEVTNKRAW
jgi:hypothetical protein